MALIGYIEQFVMEVSNQNSELISHMEMRLRTPVTRVYFFSSLTRLRREPAVSIRKKYPLEPRVVWAQNFQHKTFTVEILKGQSQFLHPIIQVN